VSGNVPRNPELDPHRTRRFFHIRICVSRPHFNVELHQRVGSSSSIACTRLIGAFPFGCPVACEGLSPFDASKGIWFVLMRYIYRCPLTRFLLVFSGQIARKFATITQDSQFGVHHDCNLYTSERPWCRLYRELLLR
jgi:hypothetical protein